VYVELHAHSAYSFGDGASLPEELALRASELGHEAMALTDHDGLWGSMEFANACSSMGRPLDHRGRDDDRRPRPRPAPRGRLVELSPGAFHLTLLVESAAGYRNLCRLVTEAHRGTRNPEPRRPRTNPGCAGITARSRSLGGGGGSYSDPLPPVRLAGGARGTCRGARLPVGLRPRRRARRALGTGRARPRGHPRPAAGEPPSVATASGSSCSARSGGRDRARNRWLEDSPGGSGPCVATAASTCTTRHDRRSRTRWSRCA
jgi:hypothetical protein